MRHQTSPTAVLWVQTLGSLGIIALVWLDEWIQLPSLVFLGRRMPPNWHECAMESVVVLVVWAIMLLVSRRLVRRLRYLEEFLRVCAWCRKIHLDGRWVPLEQYFSEGLGTATSHGICPTCAEAQLAELRAGPRAAANGRAA